MEEIPSKNIHWSYYLISMLRDDQQKHVTELDGVRGMAILMVVCFHYFPTMDIASSGWMGVDLFFALSGYLITGRLLLTRSSGDYFLRFYRNRILRIFPLYYLVLLVFYAAVFLLAKTEHMGRLAFYTEHAPGFFFFAENWTFIRHGLPADGYLNHFWSLAIEEQFYLVWPLIIYFISSEKMRLISFAGILAAGILIRLFIYEYGLTENEHILYFNTFCRMDSFVMGAALCQFKISGNLISEKWLPLLKTLVAAILIGSIILYLNADYFISVKRIFGYSCISAFCTGIIWIATDRRHRLSVLFNNRVLRYCGKISYGLYIFHWPVLLIAGGKITLWMTSQYPGRAAGVTVFSLISCLLITLLLSITSFRFFESWFLKFRK